MNAAANEFMNWLKDNHSGKENAINARNMKQWGSRREIRFMVHDLRTEGVPICSGNEGYYYASNSREVKETLNFLNSIQDDLQKVVHGLNEAYAGMSESESGE